jgi:hypothetical protein
LNITFGSYSVVLSFEPQMKDAMYEKLICKWTELSFDAPINQTTGRRYHPQTLARVARGEVENVQLRSWLEAKGICHAKTQEGNSRATGNTRNKKSRRKVSKLCDEQKSELSEIAKAIRGETYSYPTNSDHGQGD